MAPDDGWEARPHGQEDRQGGTWVWITALALVALALQSPLIFNPGYFSFDELQWWWRSAVPWRDLPWVSWSDLGAFQYRPLTFNLWLVLAHAFAEHAYLMHAVFVLVGTLNAVLIATNLRSLGVARATATAAALAFVCSPFVAYTHGWTGTLADLLVLSFGLLAFAALRALRDDTSLARSASIAFTVVLLQALALSAKESAVVLPLLLLCAAVAHDARRRVLAIALLAGAIVAAYLALRLPILLGTHGSGYEWHLADIPRRLAEYALYPWLPPLFEIEPSLEKGGWRLALAALCLAALLYALASRGWRHAGAFVVLYVGLLAPVLILEHSYNQYAYLSSAAAIGVVACAWRASSRTARALILVSAAVVCVHGAEVMLRLHEIGAIERRFHGELADLLERQASTVTVVSGRPADAWLVQRFTEHVPGYRATPFAGRVFADAGPAGSLRATMQMDGSLSPAPLPAPSR